ncbi:MAG: hypothetical protein P8011_07730 [Acidihalobacter sp.]|uniref:hypothetical protein n=1 Tax=Acidihalobacter sp. TaxID=1872108 RepID=UPI00307E2010
MEHTPEYEALFKEYFKLCSLAGEACVKLELSEDELRQRVDKYRRLVEPSFPEPPKAYGSDDAGVPAEDPAQWRALIVEYSSQCAAFGDIIVELDLPFEELRRRVERGRLEIARAQPGADGGSRPG